MFIYEVFMKYGRKNKPSRLVLYLPRTNAKSRLNLKFEKCFQAFLCCSSRAPSMNCYWIKGISLNTHTRRSQERSESALNLDVEPWRNRTVEKGQVRANKWNIRPITFIWGILLFTSQELSTLIIIVSDASVTTGRSLVNRLNTQGNNFKS